MRSRCELEIIGDMLLVLKGRELPTDIRLVYRGAKIGNSIQEKYYSILKQCNLVLISEHKGVFKAVITTRGIQFLVFYKAIEGLMRSGFRDKKKETRYIR